MKRVFTFIVILGFGISSGFAAIWQGSCGDHLTYEINSKTGVLTITGYGPMSDFESAAPWCLNGGFNLMSFVKSVSLPEGITYISNNAFTSTAITSIVIPNSVRNIGDNAFYDCKNLTFVVLPDQLTSIGDRAFFNCRSLSSLIIPNNVTYVGIYAFYNTNLKEVKYPQGLDLSKAKLRSSTNLIAYDRNDPPKQEQPILVKQETTLQPTTQPKNQPTQPKILSDVDVNIPHVNKEDNKTYVLIIANESYRNVDSVPYAIHDGEVFRQYCEQTLGITAKNHIKLFPNATLGDLYLGIDWIKQAMSINPDGRAIVYYTGHGIPDESNKTAYLLPTDGNSKNLRTAYSVDELYKELGSTERSVTVFLDACFSGAKRDGTMLASAKGVAIKAKTGVPQGKTVVFSAAQGDETAGFYREKQHGMFTYWLLKELQQTEGDVTYEQLNKHLTQHVRQCSFDENGKIQTPTVMAGTEAFDWQTWKLK